MPNAWKQFQSSPLGELLTGTAHHAHPTDVTAPLGLRFAGQTILALHIALEKAATVRVTFDCHGAARLSGIRNIRQRGSPEFGEVLRAEAAAAKATWVVVVFATGWHAVLGQRSARAEPTERSSPFARYRLMAESPEVVVPRAQIDRIYTAIDHPVLDRSLVFSVRRREIEELSAELRQCGLGIAAIRVAVAAQLEVWLATEGEAGLIRDLVITDGLTALLLNTEQGDFVPPRGAVEGEQPRQSVQRPSAVEEDIARFIDANAGRPLTFIGPEDLCAAVKKRAASAEIVRPPGHAAHSTEAVALAASVQHDLNFEAREVRPALPRSWRRVVVGAAALAAALVCVAGINGFYAARVGFNSFQLEREATRYASQAGAGEAEVARMIAEFTDATAVKGWVASNFHAQKFCYGLLRQIPPNAALDKLVLEVKDGQLTLTFVALGDQDTQLATHRAVEQGIKELKYKIASEELPVATAASARAIQYRLHIIVPDAAEGASS